MKPPKPRAIVWWQRGLADGKTCARKRQARWFQEYLVKAVEALQPGNLQGECECVYRLAFRAGYDAEKEARVRRNTFWSRPKRRVSLT